MPIKAHPAGNATHVLRTRRSDRLTLSAPRDYGQTRRAAAATEPCSNSFGLFGRASSVSCRRSCSEGRPVKFQILEPATKLLPCHRPRCCSTGLAASPKGRKSHARRFSLALQRAQQQNGAPSDSFGIFKFPDPDSVLTSDDVGCGVAARISYFSWLPCAQRRV